MSLILEQFLPYQLAVTAEAVSAGLASVYATRFGLTIPEWRVIANLGRKETLTAGDAAARASLDKVQVSRALKHLVARKLVVRRIDRADRRRAYLTLTAAGVRLHTDIATLALDWERTLLAGLSPTDRATLDRLLPALAARAAATVMTPPQAKQS
jgi:DNA-binding MarR family transcriptional regulator